MPKSTAGDVTTTAHFDRAAAITRSLLGWGVVAGPFYFVVALIQAAFRDGFDVTRHALSVLANGPYGWIQVTNLIATGLMVIAGAIGIRRALRPGPVRTWGPLLVGLFGIGMVGSGISVADPMDGFPPGTPAGPPAEITAGGLMHLAVGGIGFLALIAACFVLGQRFAGRGQRGWAWYSRVTGVLFLGGFAGIASGGSSGFLLLGFWIGIVAAMAWLAAVCVYLYRHGPHPDHPLPAGADGRF